LLRTHNREITCGLFGHSFEEYRDRYGDDLRLIQKYQIELYKLIDEQIATGMRSFVSLLQPGVALWMSDYVLMQRDALRHLGLQLHILYTQPALNSADGLGKKVLQCADSTALIHSHRAFNQFLELIERSIKMLVVERYSGIEVLCSYATSVGIHVQRYAMPELVNCN